MFFLNILKFNIFPGVSYAFYLLKNSNLLTGKRISSLNVYYFNDSTFVMKRNLPLYFSVFIFLQCSDKDVKDPCSCLGTEMCTDIFKSIHVKLQNKDGRPYALDSFQTRRVATGEIILLNNIPDPLSDSVAIKWGSYPILTDMNVSQIQKCGEEFNFMGFKNGKTVVSSNYQIGHDCCHVILKKGAQNITME